MPPSRRPAPSVERAFVYCRQSKTDGDGERSVSLASQEKMLRDLAAERGMVVVGVEIDADIRGWRDEHERPGLRKALERARDGDYDALLFYDISRVARDVFLLERLVRDLGRHGVRPVSLKEPQVEDPFYRQILAAIAEKYTRDLSAHSARGVAELARRGIPHGAAPFGYRKINRAQHPGDLALSLPDGALTLDDAHPERPEIVRDLFARFLAGATIAELRDDLQARRVMTTRGGVWSNTGVSQLLRNPAYAGDVSVGETYAEDVHEPLVSREDFQRVQAMFRPHGRHKRKRKGEQSWLEGYLLHECGQRAHLIPERSRVARFRCQHHSNMQQYWARGWARCELAPKSRRFDWLEEEVWAIVTRDLAQLSDADSAIACAEEAYAQMAPDAQRERRELLAAMEKLDAGFARAEALYLDGARSRDWLNAFELRHASERAALLARQDSLPPPPDREAIRDAEYILRQLADEMATFTPENRRLLMARLGVATFGPSGVIMWYTPAVANLIPGAASLARVTLAQLHLSPALLTSLRATFAANWQASHGS